MKQLISSIFITSLLLFSACGGGGDSSSSTPTNTVSSPQDGTNSVALQSVPYGSSALSDKIIKTQCGTAGGVAIYTGIDSNANGVLDKDERSATPYIVCNGQSATSSETPNFSIKEYALGDSACPLGGLKLTTPSMSYNLCNEEEAKTASYDFSKTGTLKGKINLLTPSSAPLRSAPLKTVSRMTGGLWLTPAQIQAAIDEDLKTSSTTSNSSVPQPIVEPIKVPINSNNEYTIEDVPSGEYSLVYVDESNNGKKIDDIFIAPEETKIQDIEDVKPTGGVNFTVASLTSGVALESASVRLNELDKNTTSNADGSVGFSNLPEGTYSITISSDGYVSKYMSFTILSGQTTNLETIELNNEKGRLVGSVEAEGVEDYANIIVYAKSADGSIFTTLTNSSGNYVFEALPVGEGYSVLAYAHDYEGNKVDNIDITTNRTSSANKLYLQRLGETSAGVTLTNVGSISGYVRFSEETDELDHAGIIVSIEGTDYEAITARDGSFILNNITSGTYTLNFTDSNHNTTTQRVQVVMGTTIFTNDIALIPKTGNLTGKVLSDDNTPVVGALVTITTPSQSLTTITDSNGLYTLNGILAGEHKLIVVKSGYGSKEEYVTIIENDTLNRKNNPIIIDRSTLQGTINIVDKDNNSGVKLTLNGANIDEAITNTNGEFTLFGIAPGNYQLQITKNGYEAQVLPVSVAKNEDIRLNYIVDMIDVADEPPLLDNKTITIDENLANGTQIGQMPILSFGDRDIKSFTVFGIGSDAIEISTDGNISVKNSAKLDYELASQYNLSVFATSESGNSFIVDLDIIINNIPENAPLLKDFNISLIETTEANISLLNEEIITSQGDTPITDINISGDGHENFSISLDGTLVINSPSKIDFETKSNYELHVTAVNEFGNSNVTDLNITILNYQVQNYQGEIDYEFSATGYKTIDSNLNPETSVRDYMLIRRPYIDKYGNFYFSNSSTILKLNRKGDLDKSFGGFTFNTTGETVESENGYIKFDGFVGFDDMLFKELFLDLNNLYLYTNSYIIKLTLDGQIDTSFGTNGICSHQGFGGSLKGIYQVNDYIVYTASSSINKTPTDCKTDIIANSSTSSDGTNTYSTVNFNLDSEENYYLLNAVLKTHDGQPTRIESARLEKRFMDFTIDNTFNNKGYIELDGIQRTSTVTKNGDALFVKTLHEESSGRFIWSLKSFNLDGSINTNFAESGVLVLPMDTTLERIQYAAYDIELFTKEAIYTKIMYFKNKIMYFTVKNIYTYDYNGVLLSTIAFQDILPANFSVVDMLINNDGEIFLITQSETTNRYKNYIFKIK